MSLAAAFANLAFQMKQLGFGDIAVVAGVTGGTGMAFMRTTVDSPARLVSMLDEAADSIVNAELAKPTSPVKSTIGCGKTGCRKGAADGVAPCRSPASACDAGSCHGQSIS
jgi:hypothetical protein